jgi:hypothetical protein
MPDAAEQAAAPDGAPVPRFARHGAPRVSRKMFGGRGGSARARGARCGTAGDWFCPRFFYDALRSPGGLWRQPMRERFS